MEPENRPYVDAHTVPGDAGTEEWADSPGGQDVPVGRGPVPGPDATTDGGAVDGSPASEFIDEPDAIAARNVGP